MTTTASASIPIHPTCAPLVDDTTTARIDELLGRMSLAEKIGQLVQLKIKDHSHSEEVCARIREGNAGSVILKLRDPAEINAVQRVAVEESPHGIPLLFCSDILHGYRTALPAPIAEACSWNPALIERAHAMAGHEARAAGFHWAFAPMIDVARDSRWGRQVEGAGEDALLGSAIAAARVRGLGADDDSLPTRLAPCPKHFAGYGAAECGIDYNTVHCDHATMWDTYLPPFAAALDAGAPSLMSGFHEWNGEPMTAHRELLEDILRQRWDFSGVVVSDFNAIEELLTFGLVENRRQAAALALSRGIDVDMGSRIYLEELTGAVAEGLVDERLVDRSVRRVLALKYWSGLMDQPYADEAAYAGRIRTPVHRELARQVARESLVLLENRDGLLPLDPEAESRIAVIGPYADAAEDMLGRWHCDARLEETTTILQGLRTRFGTGRVHFAPGCWPTDTVPAQVDDSAFAFTGDGERLFLSDEEHPLEQRLETAVALAERSDVAICCLGHAVRTSGEGAYLEDLDLPAHQQRLLEAVHATGTPVVLLLIGGRPQTVRWAQEHIPTILQVWQPGSEAGHAVADILSGHHEPCGRLCVTMGRRIAKEPTYYCHQRTGRPRHRYFDFLWPFGHGRSYTSFSYSDIELSAETLPVDGSLTVSATIRNTGARPGTEVVQCYLRDEQASRVRPVKILRGFERVTLAPGEARRVSFTLTPKDWAVVHGDGSASIEPGDGTVWIAPNAADESLAARFSLNGTARTL